MSSKEVHILTWEKMYESKGSVAETLNTIYKENKKDILDSSIVLPYPPNDKEKVYYIKSHRFIYLLITLIANFSIIVSFLFFISTSPYFYWYGSFVLLYSIHIFLSLLTGGIFGRDFNLKKHEEIKEKAKDYCPSVDIYLPVCDEPLEVLNNTWNYVRQLDWRNLNIYVLDDGAREEVRVLAKWFDFHYIRREDRPTLKKAGNIRNAFQQTRGDIFVILDADFCPRDDFLKETVPYMMDEKVAILQTPQFFRLQQEQSWIEQGASILQEPFYRIIQTNRDFFESAICVGTCALYKRKIVEPFGGVYAIDHSEDIFTGISAIINGGKVKYIPLILATGTCPNNLESFFNQQYRWCLGSLELLSKQEVWSNKLSIVQRLTLVSNVLYFVNSIFGVLFYPLPAILLIFIAPSSVLLTNIALILPGLFLMNIFMYLWSSQKYNSTGNKIIVFQYYCYLAALIDKLKGKYMEWKPSGGLQVQSNVANFKKAVRQMIAWDTTVFCLIICGSTWRAVYFGIVNYLPVMILAFYYYFTSVSMYQDFLGE